MQSEHQLKKDSHKRKERKSLITAIKYLLNFIRPINDSGKMILHQGNTLNSESESVVGSATIVSIERERIKMKIIESIT